LDFKGRRDNMYFPECKGCGRSGVKIICDSCTRHIENEKKMALDEFAKRLSDEVTKDYYSED